MNQPSPTDVLATGIGMVTPLAIGREESWRRILNGETAGRPLLADQVSHFDQLAGLLKSTPAGATVDHADVAERVANQLQNQVPHLRDSYRDLFLHDCLNNMIAFSLQEAVQDASLDLTELPRQDVGCVIGASKASLRAMQQEVAYFRKAVPTDEQTAADSNRWMNAFLPDAPLRCARFLTQAQGVSNSPVAACATGLISIVEAAQYIRSGLCDLCIAGSADASVMSTVLASFHRLGVLSKHPDPAAACRPFDQHRDGFVIGEGAAVVVLESRRHAERRNATAYAQIISGGWMTDPTGLTQIDSEGHIVTELLRRMTAITGAPDLVNLHGTATETNDLAEAGGLRRLWGANVPDCSATKGATGHLLGAAGSVEMAFTLLSLRDQITPVTANHLVQDSACGIPLVTSTSKTKAISTAAKLSLGFGGHIAGCVASR